MHYESVGAALVGGTNQTYLKTLSRSISRTLRRQLFPPCRYPYQPHLNRKKNSLKQQQKRDFFALEEQ